MPSQRHPAVRFVPELRGATQVEKELEIASQKSHAARISHAKRKHKKKPEQANGLEIQCRCKPSPFVDVVTPDTNPPHQLQVLQTLQMRAPSGVSGTSYRVRTAHTIHPERGPQI